MIAVHELGHVVGAIVTGGKVERVVLHPLTISRTDVSPNPNPATVVWLGPLFGCLIPLAMWRVVPRRITIAHNAVTFFAGLCLIANGAYIAFGSLDRVGDCGEMLRTGAPLWSLIAFGGVAIPLGLLFWHRLGSPQRFLADPSFVSARWAYSTLCVLVLVLAAELAFSAR